MIVERVIDFLEGLSRGRERPRERRTHADSLGFLARETRMPAPCDLLRFIGGPVLPATLSFAV